METAKKSYNLVNLSKKYPNKWLALTKDHKKVVSVGNKLKEVSMQSKGKDVVFLKMLPTNSYYMPAIL